jgi:nanoRNase/pAp phosphatase (c-di-AMP/oligoRNAs hydrolase)
MKMSSNILVYHSPCRDGFTAAWAFHLKYGLEFEYLPEHAGRHNVVDELLKHPHISKKRVYFVDICPPREYLLKLKEAARHVEVWDHHETTRRECGDLPFVHIDQTKSGASLAWKTLYPLEEMPFLVSLVEDADLAKWAIPNAKEYILWLNLQENTFNAWSRASSLLETIEDRATILAEAKIMKRYQEHVFSTLSSEKKRHWVYLQKSRDEKPVRFAAVNASVMQSEIGTALAETAPGGAVWYFNGQQYVFSLRSLKGGENCERVAAFYGGGGHVNAAAFNVNNLDKIRFE